MLKKMDLSEAFWDSRYQDNNTGWDLGQVSGPIKSYIDQLEDKLLKILIPGAGNAYEAEYLYQQGFKNVFIADVSRTALSNFKTRVPNFPDSQLLHANFFNIRGAFHLILEQTFFCALNPNLRQAYAEKTHNLLDTNGQLVGVLFNKALHTNKPPFGGFQDEYEGYFAPYFHFKTLEPCYNSMPSRANSELFFNFQKK
ncbi:SAM-dependent methyltransferase [Bizionia sediminis]|uniref:SAM-dependent methyltransferase n=1 Tax=Bizionia sediminis TaxID=1737064 RepID=A0ABW5KRS7_9FLAO